LLKLDIDFYNGIKTKEAAIMDVFDVIGILIALTALARLILV
jgi:hypothetical protein